MIFLKTQMRALWSQVIFSTFLYFSKIQKYLANLKMDKKKCPFLKWPKTFGKMKKLENFFKYLKI